MLFFLAAIFFVMENSYFGWNAWPQSLAECWADLFCCLLIFVCTIQVWARK